MYFNQNLSYLRKKNDLSQTAIGERIGVSSQVISNWERGYTSGVSLDILVLLSEIFMVSIDDLIKNNLVPSGSIISRNLKYLRKQSGLTQSELAHSLKLERSTIAGYETEGKEPSIKKLVSISNFFNVSVDDLLKKDLSKGGI